MNRNAAGNLTPEEVGVLVIRVVDADSEVDQAALAANTIDVRCVRGMTDPSSGVARAPFSVSAPRRYTSTAAKPPITTRLTAASRNRFTLEESDYRTERSICARIRECP
jgi:hypothetical protein